MGTLSIVMPIYNGVDRLPRMLDCLAAQTSRDFELIAVNDGSTDTSVEVLESYADRINLKLIDKENGGASTAYNRGLDDVSGDCVLMIDQDDLLNPRTVEFLLRGMEKSIADCLIFDYRDIDEERIGEVKKEFSTESGYPDLVPIMGSVLHWFIENSRNPGIWQFCFRREALTGWRFEEGITLEDNLFVFPFLTRNDIRFAHLPVALYAYIQQPTSVMHTSKLEWRLESFGKIFKGLRECLPDDDYRYLMTRHFVPELKSMWRAATFGGKRRFAAFMRRFFATELAYRDDYPFRWKIKYLLP